MFNSIPQRIGSAMIDCHAHIFHTCFDQDRDNVIDRARRAGVKAIIAVSENIDDSRLATQMCRDHPDVLHPCMGIHPDAFADDRSTPADPDVEDIISAVKAVIHE